MNGGKNFSTTPQLYHPELFSTTAELDPPRIALRLLVVASNADSAAVCQNPIFNIGLGGLGEKNPLEGVQEP